MREIKVSKSDRKYYKQLNLKCFFVEYEVYRDVERGVLHKREYTFSKSVSELIDVDLPYEISQFWGVNNFKITIISISEVDY